MPRRSSPTTPSSRELSFDDLKQGLARLQRRVSQVEAFDPSNVTRGNMVALAAPLRASIEDALGQTFGHDTAEYWRYEPAARFDHVLLYIQSNTSARAIVDSFAKHREKSLALLRQAVASLEERLSEVGVPILGRLSEMPDEVSRKVFVVHGQDTGAREAVPAS